MNTWLQSCRKTRTFAQRADHAGRHEGEQFAQSGEIATGNPRDHIEDVVQTFTTTIEEIVDHRTSSAMRDNFQVLEEADNIDELTQYALINLDVEAVGILFLDHLQDRGLQTSEGLAVVRAALLLLHLNLVPEARPRSFV
jgi:hypothetical protein